MKPGSHRPQVDLSNAFEDGKTCLEGLEERKRAGKVSREEEASTMKVLKERFREEYRKVNLAPMPAFQHV